jgi:hypothetical protein
VEVPVTVARRWLEPDDEDVDVHPYRTAGRQAAACAHVIERGDLLFEVTRPSGVTTMCRSCVDRIGHVVTFGPAVW